MISAHHPGNGPRTRRTRDRTPSRPYPARTAVTPLTSKNHRDTVWKRPETPGLSQYKTVQEEISRYSYLSKRCTPLEVETLALAKKARLLEDTPTSTLAQARARADAWRRLEEDPELAQRKLAADAWCAAFVQPKSPYHGQGITHDTIQLIVENPGSVPTAALATVREMAEQYRFFHWHLEFPGIFTVPDSGVSETESTTGWQGGFTCVVGNPPWERVKIQDREFFASAGRNDIANAKTAAIRTKMIKALEGEDPAALHEMYRSALRTSDGTIHFLLHSGRYPLTGRGDVNTYSVFAETFRMVIAPAGTAGIITPSGLATDATTAPYFANTIARRRLLAFYDFENEAKIFAGVHNQLRFAVTAIAGTERNAQRTRFAFNTRYLADVPQRRFELTPEEVLALNPNTGTLPVFRTRVDADITLGVYRRHPILIRDGATGSNPWRLSFVRLFDMANDSDSSNSQRTRLRVFDGWSYEGESEYLPLYEAKMLAHFDHRFSTYKDATQKQLNKGTLPRLSNEQHDDPNVEPLARYWIARPKVANALEGKWEQDWLLGWRDITKADQMRTFIRPCCPLARWATQISARIPGRPRAWSTVARGVVLYGLRLRCQAKDQWYWNDVLYCQADRLPSPGHFRSPQLAARLHPGRVAHPLRSGAVVHVVAASALRPGDGR